MEYAIKNPGKSDREHEIRRAYAEMSSTTNYFYSQLAQEEKEKISFPREIEYELFEQIIARYQANELRKEIGAHRETIEKLNESLSEQQEKAECLRNELREVQREANALREELNGTHASWTYRIGRAVTWLPRKVREMIRAMAHKF